MKITKSALVQRIRRRLRAQDQRLVKLPDHVALRNTIGRYAIVDSDHNAIIDSMDDLEALAREVGALGETETVLEGTAP